MKVTPIFEPFTGYHNSALKSRNMNRQFLSIVSILSALGEQYQNRGN